MSILPPDLAGLCPSCGADDNVRWCDSAPDADTWGCTQCGSTWVINVDESGAATIAAMTRDNNVNRTVLARLRGVVTMQGLMITYNNGHVEIVTAERYRADGLWIIFENADKEEVHRLNERDVRSIDRKDLNEEVPGPMRFIQKII